MRKISAILFVLALNALICGCNRSIDDIAGEGREFLRTGKPDNAVRCFSEAIKRNPLLIDAYIGRGQANLMREKFNLSIQDAEKALLLKPQNPDALLLKAQAFEGKLEIGRAIAIYNRVVYLKPDSQAGYLCLGNALAKVFRFEEAIDKFNRVIELNPDSAEVYFGRAAIYYQTDRFSRAVMDYSRAIDCFHRNNGSSPGWPDISLVYFYRGTAFYKMGNTEAARNDWLRVTRISPRAAAGTMSKMWLEKVQEASTLADNARS